MYICQYMRFRHLFHVPRLRIRTRYTARLFVSDVWLVFGRILKLIHFETTPLCIKTIVNFLIYPQPVKNRGYGNCPLACRYKIVYSIPSRTFQIYSLSISIYCLSPSWNKHFFITMKVEFLIQKFYFNHSLITSERFNDFG